MNRLNITCAIVPGVRARRLRIDAKTNPAGTVANAPRQATLLEVVRDFLTGFEVGCFTARTDSGRILAADRLEEAGVLVDRLEVALPPSSTAPFDVLVGAAMWSAEAGNGLIELSVAEMAPPELRRVSPDAFETDSPFAPPFEVNREVDESGKDLRVELTFTNAVDAAALGAADRLFRAWGALLWGFPGPHGRGWGFVDFVERHVSNVIVAGVEQFEGGDESWRALERALLVLHGERALGQVEIY